MTRRIVYGENLALCLIPHPHERRLSMLKFRAAFLELFPHEFLSFDLRTRTTRCTDPLPKTRYTSPLSPGQNSLYEADHCFRFLFFFLLRFWSDAL